MEDQTIDLYNRVTFVWDGPGDASKATLIHRDDLAGILAIVRAAIREADGQVDGCPCGLCAAVRGLPAELRERLSKEAGE